MRASTGISVSGYSRLLRNNTQFRRLWLAQLISGTGDWFYSVAIYSLLLQLTGSAKTVALAAVLQILPMFVAGPTAGAVNDRVSRRKIMLATDVARALLVLGMVVVHTREQIWILYVLLAMEVAAAAFFEAARNAVLPSVVDESDIEDDSDAAAEATTAPGVHENAWGANGEDGELSLIHISEPTRPY